MKTHTLRSAVAVMAIGVVGLAPVTAQETITVELMGNNTFDPSDITIHTGDTVHWVWVAGFHNVVSGEVVLGDGIPDGEFISGEPTTTAGTTYDLIFDDAFLAAHPVAGNVYDYYCDPHAAVGMIGTVTVLPQGVACTTNADCDDGNFCNGTEICSSGTCRVGVPLICDDANDCTDDSCDDGTGCQIAANDTVDCDDGSECTTGDACTLGACAGTAVEGCCESDADCNDGDACTNDVCANGTCSNDAISGCGASPAPNPCGAMGMLTLMMGVLGLGAMRTRRGL